MGKRIDLKNLKQENNQLKLMIDSLKTKGQELQNSLSQLATGLVTSSASQTNLTSFNPIAQNNIYAPVTINWILLMYLYKTAGVIQTAIDMPVLDALRGGLEYESKELSADDIKALEDSIEENGTFDAIKDAFVWARLFGGGALIVNTEGQDYEEPLDYNRIDGKIEFYDACRWELGSEQRIPVSGFYDFYGNKVHTSRVLTIVGKRSPFILRYQLSDWGMSEIERMVEDYNGLIRQKNAMYELMDEAKIDVYMLKGLNSQLASSTGTQTTQNRIQLVNQIKNFTNALMLDKEDSYEQKQVGFSGMAEMMKENRINMASALRMPMTKLFGLSAAGFNSGEDDIEVYNAMVESEVRQPMRKVIKKVLKLTVKALFGGDFDINFKFKPLRIMSSEQEQNIKTQKHAIYMSLVDKGAISLEELVEMEQKEGILSIQIDTSRNLMARPLTPEEEAKAPSGFADVGKEPLPSAYPGEPVSYPGEPAQSKDVSGGATTVKGQPEPSKARVGPASQKPGAKEVSEQPQQDVFGSSQGFGQDSVEKEGPRSGLRKGLGRHLS